VASCPELAGWTLCETEYGETFVSGVARGNVAAVQFHPEKSGAAGLAVLRGFLSHSLSTTPPPPPPLSSRRETPPSYCKRIVAALDVRANDAGDLVVTKGDQYDVREKAQDGGDVRNLGKPVSLARRYYEEGVDEIAFLNITGYRDSPLADQPMLQVLAEASKHIFVPLTVGGGIRDMVDKHGVKSSACQVADAYFRAGADKVSIGTDAVAAARRWLEGGPDGSTSIEQISKVYGRQAVVVSIDPRRVWVADAASASPHPVADHASSAARGPNGEVLCWYECTVEGGRKGSGLDVVQVCRAVEALGAGELLLNCIDCDGQHRGFELPLLNMVKGTVSIPVVASSGAGSTEHFQEVFERTEVEAALAASIFHRKQVGIDEIKDRLASRGHSVRAITTARAGAPMARDTRTAVLLGVVVGVAVLAALSLSRSRSKV